MTVPNHRADFIALQTFRLREAHKKPQYSRIGHYIIGIFCHYSGQFLGKGGFASVHKAFQIYTKSDVAVKIIKIDGLHRKQLEQLKQEIEIQRCINHPNIVRIYEAVWTQSHLYIFMELVKGKELFEYVSKNGALKEIFASKIFHQICQAVSYLHKQGISHRDIKTQNIMIDSDFNAKLIDFGLAKRHRVKEDIFFETFCGSPSYTAPELLEKKKYRGTGVDIWCLGVTLFVMLEASLPFEHDSEAIRKQNILNLSWEKELFSSDQAKELYQKIFKKFQDRITIEDILDSKFFFKNSLKINANQTEREVAYEDYCQIITKISNFLTISQKEVKISLAENTLGSASCLFFLLAKKQFILSLTSVQLHNETINQDRIPSRKRNYRRVTVERKAEETSTFSARKTKCSTPLRNSRMRILPLIQGDSVQKHIYSDKIPKKQAQALQLILQQKIGDQKPANKGVRCRFASKQMLKQYDLEMPKPRLRDESPDSPKRLIDCIKRYK